MIYNKNEILSIPSIRYNHCFLATVARTENREYIEINKIEINDKPSIKSQIQRLGHIESIKELILNDFDKKCSCIL